MARSYKRTTIDEKIDKDQMTERFAITKLNLELGEYSFEDLEYLKW